MQLAADGNSCTQCPANTFSPGGLGVICNPCASGDISDPGATVCLSASSGLHTASVTGCSACTMVWSANTTWLNFVFSYSGSAWVSIGVSASTAPPYMCPTSPVVGEPSGTGGAVSQKSLLGITSGTTVTPVTGFVGATVATVAGITTLSYSRKWNTGTASDGVILAGASTSMIWAIGPSTSYTPAAHTSRGVFTVVFVPAGATCTASTCSGHGTCAAGACTSCNAGYSGGSCNTCFRGYGGIDGACAPCGNNTYSAGGVNVTCAACPTGSTSGPASASCVVPPPTGNAVALGPSCPGCSLVWSATASAVQFTFSYAGNAWLCLAVASSVGPPYMYPTRAVVGLPGSPLVQKDQTPAAGFTAGATVTSAGFTSGTVTQAGGTTTLSFSRPWTTTQSTDGVITQGASTTLVWAVGTSNAYVGHGTMRGNVAVVFVPAGATCTASTCSGHGTCAGGLCVSCDAGYSGGSCNTCISGYGGTSGACAPCGNNTYSAGGVNAACGACPADFTSGPMSTSCTPPAPTTRVTAVSIGASSCPGCSLVWSADATSVSFSFSYVGSAWLSVGVAPSMAPSRAVVGVAPGSPLVQKDQTSAVGYGVGATVSSAGLTSGTLTQVGGSSCRLHGRGVQV